MAAGAARTCVAAIPAVAHSGPPRASPRVLLTGPSSGKRSHSRTATWRGSSLLAPLRVSRLSAAGAVLVNTAATRVAPVAALANQAVPAVQRGWQYSEYGPPSVLEFGEIPVPKIADDQVLVKAAAAALNPVDFKRRYGKFKASDSPLPTTPGYDVAGVVVEVGSAVTKFKIGDEVYGDISEAALNQPKQFGSLAQYTAVEEKLLALKPANLSFEQAAALPLVTLTAKEGFDRVNFKEGETVFIVNGGGGVGTMAIQLAKKVYNASTVVVTASAAKANFLKELGADEVVDYKSHDYALRPERFDFVFDLVGEGEKSIKMMKEGGRFAAITGPAPAPGFRYVLTSDGAKLGSLTPLLESGTLRPVLDSKGPFSFSQVREAFEYLETDRAFGKVVIAPIE